MTLPPENSWRGLDASVHTSAPNDEKMRHVESLIARVTAGDFDSEVSGWLREAFRDYSENDVPLEAALGLRVGPGERKMRTRILNARRDELLRKVSLELGLESGLSSWGKAERLASEIQKFENGLWREWKERRSTPPGTSSLRCLLFEVFRVARGRVPKSTAQLLEIIRNTQ